MKNKYILFIMLFPAVVFAQNQDSLYNSLVQLRNPESGAGRIISAGTADKSKCATSLAFDIKNNFDKYPADRRNTIASLLSRPDRDTSIVSPAGLFRIHYDKKGINLPQFDVNVLAVAADSAYAFEVGTLGFPPPKQDNGVGGDNLYDIYIVNISDYYGYTIPESVSNDGHYITYIVIDSDFNDAYTKGNNAARVTIAHELFHGIHTGSYRYRTNDEYYHEICASAMEEFVFDYVNDYYYYLPRYFENPEMTISEISGYGLAIFNLFIKERFEFPALKRIWDYIEDNRALKAISLVFEENGSTFKKEFSLFNTWTFFTGFRAIEGSYFEEARNYPLLKVVMSVNYSPPQKMVMCETNPVSNNLFLFTTGAGSANDSIYAMISNSDYRNGYENIYQTSRCDYYLGSSSSSGGKLIINNLYGRVDTYSSGVISDINFAGNKLIEVENPSVADSESPYPQPFNYLRHNSVSIPVPAGASDNALLYIYTLNMKLIYSSSLKVFSEDKPFVRWNGLSDENRRLPNGVYFFIVKRDDSISKGKLVIQNE